jgi:hypothetical protein
MDMETTSTRHHISQTWLVFHSLSVVTMATSIYNHHRFSRAILKKFRKTDATFTLELYPDYWRFQGHVGDLAVLTMVSNLIIARHNPHLRTKT